MSYEVEFKTGAGSAKLDILISKLEKIATLSDQVSRKQLGGTGVATGARVVKTGGTAVGGTDTTLVSALKHLDSSVVKLTSVISSGAGRGAARAATAKGTKAADLQLLSLNQQIKSARKSSEARIKSSKLSTAAEAADIRRLSNLRLVKLNSDIKAARVASEARIKSSRQSAAAEAADIRRLADLRLIQLNNDIKAARKAAESKIAAAKKASQTEAREAKKAADAKVKAAKKAAAAEAKLTTHHKSAVIAAGALRAGMYASGIGIGLFTAQTVLAAATAYALVKAIRAVVASGANFTEAMARTNAIMGANTEMAKRNAAEVRELAKTTVFTATEAAKGLTFLAMAGLKGDEAIQALPGTLNLASIGMIDMATSADMATNVMNEFGKRSSDLDDIVNSMALSVTSSNTTIQQLGAALSYVGPVAHATNTKLNETIAMISTMADSGVKGTRAGTALRRAISNLLSPTKKVAKELDGLGISVRNNYNEMRSMVDIMRDLAEATDDVGVLTRLFGVRAAPGMIAVWVDMKNEVKGLTPELVKLKKAMDKVQGSKFAEEMRKDVEDHLKGDWMKTMAAAEEAALKFFDVFEDPLRDAAKSMAEFVNENSSDWADWAESIREETGKAINDFKKLKAGMKFLSIDMAMAPILKRALPKTEESTAKGELNKNKVFLDLYTKDVARFNRQLKRMDADRVSALKAMLKDQLTAESKARLVSKTGTITRDGSKEASAKLKELQDTLDAVETRAAKLEVERVLKSDKYKADKFQEAIAEHNRERTNLRKQDLDDSLSAIQQDLDNQVTGVGHRLEMERIKYNQMSELRREALQEAKEDARKLIDIEIAAQKVIVSEKSKAVEDIRRRPAEAQDVSLLGTREEAYQEELKELIELEKLRHTTTQEYAEADRANWREEKLHYKGIVDEAKKSAKGISDLVEVEQRRNNQLVAQIDSYRATGNALASDADLKSKAVIETKRLEIGTMELALARLREASAAEEAIAALEDHVIAARQGLRILEEALTDRKGLEAQVEKYKTMEKLGKNAASELKGAFADMLFNPFDKGLEGMVTSFAASLQRMLSDAVATEIVDAIFSSSATSNGGKTSGDGAAGFFATIFSSWFGAGKALGGPVMAGGVYPVNEKGRPEMLSVGGEDFLMMGGQGGQVTANDKIQGGGDNYYFTFQSNVDDPAIRHSAGQAGKRLSQIVAMGKRNR